MQEVLHVGGMELQLAAASSFLTILQDDIVLIQTHTHSILQIVLLYLEHRDAGQCASSLEVWGKMQPFHYDQFVKSGDMHEPLKAFKWTAVHKTAGYPYKKCLPYNKIGMYSTVQCKN